MKQDRFLTGILVGIGLLVLLAVGMFFIRRTTLDYGAEDTPAGVLHNYLVALGKNDYQKAYSYLAEDTNKPSYDSFRNAFILNWITPDTSSLSQGDTSLSGDEAAIQITIINSSGDPFSEPYRQVDRALLRKQNGAWKVRSLPAPFFSWDWYQPGPEVKPGL